MDCFQCGATYNEKENCPRLLIECGHSLCQKCLIQCCLQGSFSCPECGTLHKSQNISDFPKNLALLHLKSPPLVEKRSNPSFGSEVGNSRNQEAGLVCRKHKKKIEGNKEKFSFV